MGVVMAKMDRPQVWAETDVDSLANAMQQMAETDDPRVTIGPVIKPPTSYWRSLARAYIWMRNHSIKHISERGR